MKLILREEKGPVYLIYFTGRKGGGKIKPSRLPFTSLVGNHIRPFLALFPAKKSASTL